MESSNSRSLGASRFFPNSHGMSTSAAQAYAEGFEHGLEPLMHSWDNPYTDGDYRRFQWADGFNKGKAQRLKDFTAAETKEIEF